LGQAGNFENDIGPDEEDEYADAPRDHISQEVRLNRLVKCIDRTCPGHHRTVSPEAEAAICLPRSIFGWDMFCSIGHRRFSRHWSVPQIRGELQDSYQICVSDDAIEDVIARYQAIVAAREQDSERLAEIYRDVDDVVLSIDGLQPERGHETLYVVRELTKKRVVW
jgi:hypothetical protein